MSSLYHVALSHTSSLPASEARARILSTGRRLYNLDRVLRKSPAWALVTLCADVTHPDEICATSEGFIARCLSDAWVHRNNAWDAAARANDPVALAFKGHLDSDESIFDPTCDRPAEGRVPCPVFFLSLDASDDLLNTTFVVPQTWFGDWRGDDHFDSAAYGSRSEDAIENWKTKIEATLVPCAVRLRYKESRKNGPYQHVAYQEGALYAVAEVHGCVARLDEHFKPHPVPWSKRSATIRHMWSDGTSLWVAKAKGGLEIRGDEVVAKIKTKMKPSFLTKLEMAGASDAIDGLPLTQDEGGLGDLVYAGMADGDTWIVTTSGLIGRMGAVGVDWCIVDAVLDDWGVVATGATTTSDSIVLTGACGLLEVSLATLRAAMASAD